MEKLFDWLRNKQNFLAVAVAGLMLVLHMISIGQVDSVIYDEYHYVREANALRLIAGAEIDESYFLIAEQEGYSSIEDYKDQAYRQHTPLGKLLIAAGIEVFGDNPYGWRVLPSLFGVFSIILFYFICLNLSSIKWLPLVATFIFAFENLSFTMSNLAMLDVFSVTFMMASFLAYLNSRYVLTGALIALSVIAKLSGVFGIGVIALHWFLIRRRHKTGGLKFLLSAAVSFVFILVFVDYLAIHQIIYPWDRLSYMMNYHSDLTFSSYAPEYIETLKASRPWEWLILPQSVVIWPDPTYETSPNWNLWVLIVPSICYTAYCSIKSRWDSYCAFAFLWFSGVFLSWLAIYLIWDRLMYEYYIYPAMGAVCLAMGYAICQSLIVAEKQDKLYIRWAIRLPIVAWLALHLLMFLFMAPVV